MVGKHQVLKIAIVEARNYQTQIFQMIFSSIYLEQIPKFKALGSCGKACGKAFGCPGEPKLGFCANLILKTGPKHITRVT